MAKIPSFFLKFQPKFQPKTGGRCSKQRTLRLRTGIHEGTAATAHARHKSRRKFSCPLAKIRCETTRNRVYNLWRSPPSWTDFCDASVGHFSWWGNYVGPSECRLPFVTHGCSWDLQIQRPTTKQCGRHCQDRKCHIRRLVFCLHLAPR